MGSSVAFDYDSPNVPDTVVADVVAAIRSDGKPPPLSDEEREQRRIENEIWRWQCQQREEEWAFEYRQRQAEAESIARQEAALEIAERNRKARLERQAAIAQQVREREFADLRLQSAQHQAWQSGVQRAVRNTTAAQQQQALLADLESHFNPAPPTSLEPITEVVVVSEDEAGSPNLGDRDFSVDAFMKKPRSWW